LPLPFEEVGTAAIFDIFGILLRPFRRRHGASGWRLGAPLFLRVQCLCSVTEGDWLDCLTATMFGGTSSDVLFCFVLFWLRVETSVVNLALDKLKENRKRGSLAALEYPIVKGHQYKFIYKKQRQTDSKVFLPKTLNVYKFKWKKDHNNYNNTITIFDIHFRFAWTICFEKSALAAFLSSLLSPRRFTRSTEYLFPFTSRRVTRR